MHNKRVKEELVKYLKKYGEKNTHQIYKYLDTRFRNSPSMASISNLLRSNKFYKAGYTEKNKNGKRIRVCIWGLKKD